MKFDSKLFLIIFLLSSYPTLAQSGEQAAAGSTDPLVEAHQKLLSAKGSYKTIKQQETAIENMRKATKLSLSAAKLRAKAEKLQAKADSLVTKANQVALSRGLYVTNPTAPGAAPINPPVMDQPPPAVIHSVSVPSNTSQTAESQSFVPLPGQPINIILPRNDEVSLSNGTSPSN